MFLVVQILLKYEEAEPSLNVPYGWDDATSPLLLSLSNKPAVTFFICNVSAHAFCPSTPQMRVPFELQVMISGDQL